ncbi:MAG TPA: hypothetical protein VF784_12795 [Anaerolineales bacterium]
MLNPFIQIGADEKRRKSMNEAEEYPQMNGYSVDTASPRPPMGLWLGRLLIRMGRKLAKEDVDLKISRENA